MSCELRSAYLDGRLTELEARSFEAHAEQCSACAEAVAHWGQVENLLRDWGDERTGARAAAASSQAAAQLLWVRAAERRRLRRYQGALVAALLLLGLQSFWVRGGAPAQPESRVLLATILYQEGPETTLEEGGLIAPEEGRVLTRIGADLIGVEASSAVEIEAAGAARTELHLRQGSVAARVEPRDPGESFIVRAGSHRVRVIGTTFGVERLAEGGLRVRVSEGEVQVSDAQREWWVRGGQALTIDRAGVSSFSPLGEQQVLQRLLSRQAWTSPEPLVTTASDTEEASPATELPPQPPEAAPSRPRLPPRALPTAADIEELVLAARLDEAKGLAEVRLAARPQDAETWALAASIEQRIGNEEAALQAWLEVTTLGTPSAAARARAQAARILQARGQHARAVPLLETLLGEENHLQAIRAELLLRLATSLLALNEEARAHALLREVIREHPGTAPATAARHLLREPSED